MRSGIIYKIQNKVNSKVYIGSSICYKRRKENHLYLLRRNKHYNLHLQSAFNKYKEKSFNFNIIDTCDFTNLIEREQYYITLYQSSNNKSGYNISPTAFRTTGVRCKESTKEKISIANKKAYKNGFSKEHINKLKESHFHLTPWNKGKTYKRSKPFSKQELLNRSRSLMIPITQYNLKTGKTQIWRGQAEIARRYKIPKSTMSYIVREKRIFKNSIWKFKT